MRAVFLALSALLVGSPAIADVVELTTGERIEGKAAKASDEKVTVEVGGQTVTFDKAKVRAIYFGAAPATGTQPNPAKEALMALKALQTAARAGINRREYVARLIDTQVKVEQQYLESPASQGDPPRRAIELAMTFYRLMATAWQGDIPGARTLLRDPILRECPALYAKVSNPGSFKPEIVLWGEREMFWECASQRIAEAEALVK
jgi:hypothetical protein